MSGGIVIFDGVCLLCQSSVQFILLRDKKEHIHFASFQSTKGRQLLEEHQVNPDQVNTIVYIENKQVYIKSTAVLKIIKQLQGLWPLMYVFILIPRPIRDAIYAWIAKNRYRWFGKRKTCFLPGPKWKHRFLDDEIM